MNLSYKRLQKFLDLSNFSIEQITEQITLKICEVELVKKPYNFLENIIVALVVNIIPHPNADRLSIVEVDIGSEKIQIVTGASNIELNKKYPLAKIGATLPNGMFIKSSKLRGESSQGMLCSSEELTLVDFLLKKELPNSLDENGIWTLPDTFLVGKSLLEILELKDTVIIIDNKSITHRPDLWGHYGFARELAAILDLGQPINPCASSQEQIFKAELPELKVHVDKNISSAYSLTKISNLHVESSSYEIQSYLLHIGMRPINNLVDLSNVILHDIGQPNHFFDANKVKLPIFVKPLESQNTLFVTLNDQNVNIKNKIPVITNNEQLLAIAGVIGGKSSGVDQNTTTVYFESAHFHRMIIRETVSNLGIRTDSSQRFEKGLDPSNIRFSIRYLKVLLNEIFSDISFDSHVYTQHEEIIQNKIITSYSYIKQRLGDVKITSNKIKNILELFNFKVESSVKDNDQILVKIPSFRSYYDIEIQEDLVEEIGRFVGYANITAHPFLSYCTTPNLSNSEIELEENLRIVSSVGLDYTEVYNYSFITPEQFNLDLFFSSSPIPLKNPINQESPYLRNSLFASLLQNIQNNYRKSSIIRFYELERIFLPSNTRDTKVEEKKILAFMAYKEIKKEFITDLLKELVHDLMTLLEKSFLNMSSIKIERNENSEGLFHPSRSGNIYYLFKGEKKLLFRFGQIHPKICAEHKLPHSIVYADILLENLESVTTNSLIEYLPLIKFPSSCFEFTLLVDKFIDFSLILEKLHLDKKEHLTKEKMLLNKIFIKDIQFISSYEGSSIEDKKKAVSLSVTWINPTRTIKSDELKILRDKLVSLSEKKGYALK